MNTLVLLSGTSRFSCYTSNFVSELATGQGSRQEIIIVSKQSPKTCPEQAKCDSCLSKRWARIQDFVEQHARCQSEGASPEKRDWETTCDLLQSINLSKSRELHTFMYKEYTLTCCCYSVAAQRRRVSSCGIKSCRHQHNVWLKFFSYWNHYWTESCKVLRVSIYRI